MDGSASAGASGASVSASLTTTKSPDVIYVVVAVDAGTINVPTATGLVFTQRGSSVVGTNEVLAAFYAIASSPLSAVSITATASGNTDIAMVAFGISGANTSSPFDSHAGIPATATGTGTSASVTINTSNANDFIIGAFGDNGTSPTSGGVAGTGFTLIATQNDTVDNIVDSSAEYEIVSSPQTNLAVAFTTDPSATNWAALADAVVAAPVVHVFTATERADISRLADRATRNAAYSRANLAGALVRESIFARVPGPPTNPTQTSLQVAGSSFIVNTPTFSNSNPIAGTYGTPSSESEVQILLPGGFSYTVHNLGLEIGTSSTTLTMQVVSRVNGVNGNLIISVPAGVSGIFEDTTHVDSFTTATNYDYFITSGGTTGGAITIISIWATMVYSGSGPILSTVLFCGGPTLHNFGTTRFFAVNGGQDSASTERVEEYIIRFPATWQGLSARVLSASDGASSITSRINNANGNQTVSPPANTTGLFQDTTHTDALGAGNIMDWVVVTGGTTRSMNLGEVYSFLLVTAPSVSAAQISGPATGANANSTLKVAIAGSQNTGGSVKLLDHGYLVSDLFVNISSNSLTGGSTVRTQKNGVNGNLVISVPAGKTGLFEDTTHTDTFAQGDLINYVLTTGSGPSGTDLFSQFMALQFQTLGYSRLLQTNLAVISAVSRAVFKPVVHVFSAVETAAVILFDKMTRMARYIRLEEDFTTVSDKVTTVFARFVHHFLAVETAAALFFDRLTSARAYVRAITDSAVFSALRRTAFTPVVRAFATVQTGTIIFFDRLVSVRNYTRTLRTIPVVSARLTGARNYLRKIAVSPFISGRISTSRKYTRLLSASPLIRTAFTGVRAYSRTFQDSPVIRAVSRTVRTPFHHIFNSINTALVPFSDVVARQAQYARRNRAVAIVTAKLASRFSPFVPKVVAAFFADISTRFDEHTTRGRETRI